MNQEQIENLCRMLRLPAASRSEVLTKAIAKLVDEKEHYEERSTALCLLLNCSEADLLQKADFHKTKFKSYANVLDEIAKILDVGGNGSEAMVDAVRVYKEGRDRERAEMGMLKLQHDESQATVDRLLTAADEVSLMCAGFQQVLGIPHGSTVSHTLKGVELALSGRPGLLGELEAATAERDTFLDVAEKRGEEIHGLKDEILKHQELLKTLTKECEYAMSGWREAFNIAIGKDRRIAELMNDLDLMTKARDGCRDRSDELPMVVKDLCDDSTDAPEDVVPQKPMNTVADMLKEIAKHVGVKPRAGMHITHLMGAILDRLKEGAVTTGSGDGMDTIVVDATLEQAIVLLREWPMTKVVEVTGAHVPVRFVVKT